MCDSLIEEAPVGICLVQDGRIVYGNRRLRELTGSPASADLPREALSMVHPGDRALVARRLESQLAGPEALPSCTVRFVRRDGGVREMEFSTRKVDYHGRPAIQGTLIDVTARLDAERNLQADAVRFEESNRFHQLFCDIISHDLMNPVWIAENYLRLIMDGSVTGDKSSFYEGMRGALAKARGILVDARTYLRVQDLVAYNRENIELGQLAEVVAKSLRPLGAEKGQKIIVTAAGSAVISANPLIREVVSQLLSNAIKYGQPDSAIEVLVSAGPPVRLEVRDRGSGVPEEDRERIFQRFGSREKGPIAGVGLGLAIVRRIMELHGGRIRVEGNPDGGSLFVAEFPAGR